MSRHAFLAALIVVVAGVAANQTLPDVPFWRNAPLYGHVVVVAGAVAWLLVALERARSWGAGFSIGAVTFRTPPADADDMLHRAGVAVYVAKQRGNQVVFRVA
jgi:GGDEF domain-containing protein